MRDTLGHSNLKSRTEQIVEQRHGASVENLLRRLYVADGLPQDEVARVLGVDRKAVIRWMGKYGIPARDRRKVAA
ncbi:MAG TPA: hypothetical protein DCQ64_14025 [Candidatus Rokubacteria bacterium]|nr:hypothetical protein [Candidatus Rokubacteria bacterium]